MQGQYLLVVVATRFAVISSGSVGATAGKKSPCRPESWRKVTMKALMCLFALGVAVVLAAREAEGQTPPARPLRREAVIERPARPSNQYHGKDYDYWNLRVRPPFTVSQRKEAIEALGWLVSNGRANSGTASAATEWDQWVSVAIVPTMTELLQDKEASIRADAARAFGTHIHEIGATAIPALAQLLQDRDERVRKAAANALGQMGEKAESTASAIVKAAREDPTMAFDAAMSLQRLGPKGLEVFLTMFDDQNDCIRYAAVRSFVVQGQYAMRDEQKRQVVPKLRKLLDDPSPRIRGEAVSVVPPAHEVWPAMFKLLRDNDAGVRAKAAFAVPAVAEAMSPIIELLTDPDARGAPQR